MTYLERGLARSENGEGRGPRISFFVLFVDVSLSYSGFISMSFSKLESITKEITQYHDIWRASSAYLPRDNKSLQGAPLTIN